MAQQVFPWQRHVASEPGDPEISDFREEQPWSGCANLPCGPSFVQECPDLLRFRTSKANPGAIALCARTRRHSFSREVGVATHEFDSIPPFECSLADFPANHSGYNNGVETGASSRAGGRYAPHGRGTPRARLPADTASLH